MSLFRVSERTKSPADGEGEVSNDDVFDLLANSRRRTIIQSLDEDGPLSKRELVEYVAAEEGEKTIEQISNDERKRVHVALHQVHLPKLVKHSIIEEDDGEYRLTDAADVLVDHIQMDHSLRGKINRWF